MISGRPGRLLRLAFLWPSHGGRGGLLRRRNRWLEAGFRGWADEGEFGSSELGMCGLGEWWGWWPWSVLDGVR